MTLDKSPQLESNEKNENENKPQTELDGGFGWIVVLGSFFIHFVSAGIGYSFGIIYVCFLTEFGESKAYTSWVLSLFSGVGSVLGPLSTFLTKRYGCRAVEIGATILYVVSFFGSSFATNIITLIFTTGIAGGYGNALTILPAIIAVTKYFEKRRAFATGIAISGAGLGIFVFPFLVSFLTDKYGWRITMRILAAVVLSCALFGISFRPINLPTQENSNTSQRKQSKHDDYLEQTKHAHFKNSVMNFLNKTISAMNLDLFKNPVYVLFCLSSFLTCLGYYAPFHYITDKALTMDIPKENACQLISIIGIANTVGRLCLGYICDKPFINRLWVYSISLIICGIATALSFLCFNYVTLMIFSVVFGFTCASLMTLNLVILADFLGLDRLESAFGIVLFSRGVSSFIGSPIVGHLYDTTQSYTPGFLFAGISIFFSGAILFATPLLQKCLSSSQRKSDQIEKNAV